MRVIAGTKKRLLLKTVPGMGTRPTTDRIKETLFNMISDELYDAVFLDIFAGSGQIGIEALSRGCKMAYFIENNRMALQCITDNLIATDLVKQAKIIPGDFHQALANVSNQQKVDIVFMDPPYNKGIEKEVLMMLKEMNVMSENALIIVEASLETDFSYLSELGYDLLKEKTYKTNKHIFLEEHRG